MSGLCGVVTRGNCGEVLLFGTDYHSHLGSQLAGLAWRGERFDKKIHDISQGQFKAKFADVLPAIDGNAGIGVISDSDAQPLLIHSRFGTYALAMTGLVENKRDLVAELFRAGSVFSETSGRGINAVELLAKIIETGDDLADGIECVFDRIHGSASMLILTGEGIYAVRDRLGRTPLVVGEKDGDYLVASESCALTNLGFRTVKLLGPGEVVRVRPGGIDVVRPARTGMRICTFLWIYTGYPASAYEGIGVELVRERCGAFLARRDAVTADLVSGVPDSGMGHAIGYAMESGVPLRRALVKYTPGYGRSYIPPTQAIRDQVAMMKLIPVPEVVAGQRIVLCEDSIVRGTQLRNYTLQKLRAAEAKEIHVRPACPPLMFPCRFALSTRKVDELIARQAILAMEGDYDANVESYLDEDSAAYRRMVAWITGNLGATTLRYQRIDDMVEAVGLPKDDLCLYCWNGDYVGGEDNPRQRTLKLL
jgi:amidophosphoribosyltransferase